MSPIDRIAQLNAEVGTLTRENVLLRSQLHDAQEQAKRDSETIARLAKDKERMDWLCSDAMEANCFIVYDFARVSPDCLRATVDREISTLSHRA